MSATVVVTLDDLESALGWVSAGGPFENAAYVSKATGRIFYASDDGDSMTEDELPEDVEDSTRYLPVPHKNDLDLGRDLVLRFVDEHMPGSHDEVRGYFRRRGAYARFKDLLHRAGRLEQWFEYERRATQEALLAWAADNGLTVVPGAVPGEAGR